MGKKQRDGTERQKNCLDVTVSIPSSAHFPRPMTSTSTPTLTGVQLKAEASLFGPPEGQSEAQKPRTNETLFKWLIGWKRFIIGEERVKREREGKRKTSNSEFWFPTAFTLKSHGTYSTDTFRQTGLADRKQNNIKHILRLKV